MGRHAAPRKKLSWRERRKIRREAADRAERDARARLRIWPRPRTASDETSVDLPPITKSAEGG